jgi:sugar phosphate isomerase/epimerase
VPYDTTTWQPKDLFPGNRRAAEEARALGTSVVRSCSGGFFRWGDDAPSTEQLLDAMATALRPQRRMLEELGVTLAIELHFEFTTHELLRLFEACDAEPGGWLGVCLDTFNMLPMLEDPLAGTERILPWVVATHVKDGGLALDSDGLMSFPVTVGAGVVDLRSVLERLATFGRPINLSLEDHGGSFKTPFFDPSFLTRFPDLTVLELSRLIATARLGGERLQTGELRVTERDEWPGLCQARTRAGLKNLRRLVKQIEVETK